MSRRYLHLILKNLVFIVVLLTIIDYFGIFKHAFELSFDQFNYPMHGNVVEYANDVRFQRHIYVAPINKYNYSYIHNPSHKCIAKGLQSVPHMVLLIKSAVNHFERRAAIRRTWGCDNAYPEVRMVFLLGSDGNNNLDVMIENEYQQFNDIVKSDFVDSYYNNTIKTLIGFRWVVEFCAESSYYMFVDDDYYVSIKNVLRFIQNPLAYPSRLSVLKTDSNQNGKIEGSVDNFTSTSESNKLHKTLKEQQGDSRILFAGFVIKSSPHRHKPSKWYISLSDYPFAMWPPYITAGAYILSKEALVQMYFVSMFTKHFKFDDVYLGILAFKANIVLTHCPEFYFRKAIYSAPVDYMNVIASHGYDDYNELMQTWFQCKSAKYA